MIKDKFYPLGLGEIKLFGTFENKLDSVCEGLFKQIDMTATADCFRNTADGFAIGEFWGKLMRAICLTYKYNQDAVLYKIINDAVDDMLSVQKPDGCISTVPYELQPNGSCGSDLWERKYVLLGMLGAYEVTRREDILTSMHKMALHIASQVGNKPKTPVTETGWAFGGIESTSILEPIVRVYMLTGDDKILDLAKYLVESGGCSREDIFKAIYNGKSPKDIGSNGVAEQSVAKAYEMMSCFEGLTEYYRVTGEEWTLTAVEKLFDKIVEEELTILGSGGADAPFNLGPGTGEQWNYTRFEQTNPQITVMMETCVTVTWMKLCYQLLKATGEEKYAAQIEKSAYNLIFGALRGDGKFFEYFPKLNGYRNRRVNFSYNIGGIDLSCCTANGPMGLVLIPFAAAMKAEDGLVINIYQKSEIRAEINGDKYSIDVLSDYPKYGEAELVIHEIPEGGRLYLRIPSFAEAFSVESEAGKVSYDIKDGYAVITAPTNGSYKISFPYSPVLVRAPKGSYENSDRFYAVTYGPLVLARDIYFDENPLEPLDFSGGITDAKLIDCDTNFAAFEIKLKDKTIHMLDYCSAGREWNEKNKNEFAVWLPDA